MTRLLRSGKEARERFQGLPEANQATLATDCCQLPTRGIPKRPGLPSRKVVTIPKSGTIRLGKVVRFDTLLLLYARKIS